MASPMGGTPSNSIGSVNSKVAVGLRSTCSARWMAPSRRGRSEASATRFAVSVASVRVVSARVAVPVTSGVRATAVAAPMLANSSSMRNPTKVPAGASKSYVDCGPC